MSTSSSHTFGVVGTGAWAIGPSAKATNAPTDPVASTHTDAPKHSDAKLPRPPKTAVLGAGGFLGRSLLAAYRGTHGDVIATTRTGQPGGLGQSTNVFKLDLASPDLTALHLVEQGYTDVIISGAMTSIGRCEREPKGAWAANCDGPLAIARQLASRGLKTIVFSSDYVFHGEKGGYEDDAPTAPQNVYGQTKAELERRLPEVCGNNWLVIRLSKVFDTHRGDGTLLDEMAAKLTSGQEIAVAHDQVFCPTHMSDVVRATLALQAAGTCGIVNLCSPQVWARWELGMAMAVALGADKRLVRRISLEDLGESFVRPKHTDMRCKKLNQVAPMRFASMDECIAQVASNYKTRGKT